MSRESYAEGRRGGGGNRKRAEGGEGGGWGGGQDCGGPASHWLPGGRQCHAAAPARCLAEPPPLPAEEGSLHRAPHQPVLTIPALQTQPLPSSLAAVATAASSFLARAPHPPQQPVCGREGTGTTDASTHASFTSLPPSDRVSLDARSPLRDGRAWSCSNRTIATIRRPLTRRPLIDPGRLVPRWRSYTIVRRAEVGGVMGGGNKIIFPPPITPPTSVREYGHCICWDHFWARPKLCALAAL